MLISISKLFLEHGKILQEYCQLASLKELSEQDVKRLEEILILAKLNPELTFLLNEADHFMAHDLGLLNDSNRKTYKDQQSKLREYLGSRQNKIASTVQSPQDYIQPDLGIKHFWN